MAAFVGMVVLSVLAPAAAAQAPAWQPVGGSVSFLGAPGTTFTVPGHGRFTDRVDVVPGPDGRLVVVNELSIDRYVDGLAEVPASWPMETLKAQAVAARTYAWYSITLGTFRSRGYDFDICATVDCQVFHGRAVVESPNGGRWREAVEATAGQVLTWEGQPILARFFSSSGGHTRNNEHVYGNDGRTAGPRPYLVGVPDPDEAISPHHRWQLRLTRVELDRLFANGTSLSAAVPVARVEWIPSDGSRVDQVRATRTDGHVVELSASKFRAWVSEVGPRLLPNRFPPRTPSGKALPDGLPSSRFDFALTADEAVITGKGWGHGVGMSQWGARGKAERGMTYDDILAAYYGGLRPDTTSDLPARVRVGLSWDAMQVTVRADGPYTIVAGGNGTELPGGVSWDVGAGNTDSVLLSGPPVAWSPDITAPPPAALPPSAGGPADGGPVADSAPEPPADPRPPYADAPADDAANADGLAGTDGAAEDGLLKRVQWALVKYAPPPVSSGLRRLLER
ncbi:MAG: SpoIID/LytB domain-containing protein [Actinobacteria bacterium]|nr:SpoIID/LytB domain-containing protein [Actinomycetota bacterium]